jgi:hypothetical protein
MGHRFRLFTYEDIVVPDGVELADADRIVKQKEIFEFKKSITPFSDLFRYELLHKVGGWWIDADVLCLRSDIPSLQHAWAEENDGSICNAVLKFPAGDQRLRKILEDARSRVQTIAAQHETSDLVTTHLQQQPKIVASTELVKQRAQQSLFIHLWNGMLEYCAPTLIKRPPPGCYLDAVYERYLPGYRQPASYATYKHELNNFKTFNEQPNIKEYLLKVRQEISSFSFDCHQSNAPAYVLRCLRHSMRHSFRLAL